MFLRYNLLPFIWAGFILLLSGTPGNEMPNLSFWDFLSFDTAAHAFVYAVLVVLMITGFIRQYSFLQLRYSAITFAVIIGVSYGALMEFLQLFLFSQRQASIVDIVANTVGCFAGVGVFFLIYGKGSYRTP